MEKVRRIYFDGFAECIHFETPLVSLSLWGNIQKIKWGMQYGISKKTWN